MAEVPSVVYRIPEYAALGIDGVSIGSNDLTQLMLGVDRDSEICAELFDESDAAVLDAIRTDHRRRPRRRHHVVTLRPGAVEPARVRGAPRALRHHVDLGQPRRRPECPAGHRRGRAARDPRRGASRLSVLRMSGLLDWWYRIRRVVQPPGTPATRPAIPAEIGSAIAAELTAVFAHVDQLEPELQAAESAGNRKAERVRTRAGQDAGRILAEGHQQIAAVRAEAAAKRRGEVEEGAHEPERRAAERVAALERAARGSDPVARRRGGDTGARVRRRSRRSCARDRRTLRWV